MRARTVANLWLNLVYERPILVHIVASFVLAIGSELAIASLSQRPEAWSEKIVIHGGVIIGSLLIPWALTVLSLISYHKMIMRILATGRGAGRTTIAKFLDEELSSMLTTLRKLTAADGASLDVYQVAQWTRRCFETAKGRYIGTDSNVPSSFRKLYADYLSAHGDYIKRTGHKDTKRILVNTVAAIRHDKVYNEKDYNWFFGWHDKENVGLFLVDRNVAQKCSRDQELDCTDVGFWEGNFALLFKPQPDLNRIVLRLRFPGHPDYEKCQKYLKSLERESSLVSAHLPLFTDELSEEWEEFVHPEKRLRTLGPFLTDVLSTLGSPTEIRILDAAMGIGVETTFLTQAGFYVVGNEIEPALQKKAMQYSTRHGVILAPFHLSAVNWLNFKSHFGTSAFHCILVLGNSLCLLDGLSEVQDALEQFYDVLTPGGLLIVDERNFDPIMNSPHWDGSEFREPWKNFRYSFRVMYCGKLVRGAPFRKVNGRVIFEYHAFKDNRPVKKVGELSMYPFKRGALKDLLKRVGFTQIETYSDLNLLPEFKDDADFYTYVCKK